MNSVAEKPTKKKRFAFGCVLLSVTMGIGITACYLLQPDGLAPVTIIPAWLWLIPAIFMLWLGRLSNRLLVLGCLAIWLTFSFLFFEEARSLLRFANQAKSKPRSSDSLRVATLNCNFGNLKAIAELGEYQPDLILLQESPGQEQVSHIAKEFFGESGNYVSGGDTSIIFRGRLAPIYVERNSKFTQAKITTEKGISIDVFSLRLNPPVFRADFWSGGFWSDHSDIRKKHRAELKAVANQIDASTTPGSYLIVGGDFNLPANDGALEALPERLGDTFFDSGSGWCNTATSDWPLFRVDQIWASHNLQPVISKAYPCINSDHRFVVVDLMIGRTRTK